MSLTMTEEFCPEPNSSSMTTQRESEFFGIFGSDEFLAGPEEPEQSPEGFAPNANRVGRSKGAVQTEAYRSGPFSKNEKKNSDSTTETTATTKSRIDNDSPKKIRRQRTTEQVYQTRSRGCLYSARRVAARSPATPFDKTSEQTLTEDAPVSP